MVETSLLGSNPSDSSLQIAPPKRLGESSCEEGSGIEKVRVAVWETEREPGSFIVKSFRFRRSFIARPFWTPEVDGATSKGQ